MKLLSRVMVAVFTAGAALSSAAVRAETFVSLAQETYIGSVPYQGGLMERGLLTLPAPLEIKSLRFDIPSFCVGEIFEAGTVTEGVYDVADQVRQNVFSVNQGRGLRARSVFISVNGPVSAGCSILVFSVHGTSPTPTPPTPQPSYNAVTCVTNLTPGMIRANLLNQGQAIPLVLVSGQTSMVVTPMVQFGQKPQIILSYDRDPSFGYDPMNVLLDSEVQSRSDCATAAQYHFVKHRQTIDVVRVH